MFEKLSIHSFTTTITDGAYGLWDTAKNYLTTESAHDEKTNKTAVPNDEKTLSLVSTLQQSASWFCHCPKKLILLGSLALVYYANQTHQGQTNVLDSSYAINPMEGTSYFLFPSISEWNYQIAPSTQTLTHMAVIYSASSLLHQSHQYTSGNFLISPLSLMALSSFLPVLPAQTIETEFLKVFGGSSTDYDYAVRSTLTGDIVMAGSTISFGAGSQDMLVAKLYGNGSLAWARTLGGSNIDIANALALTAAGDIVVTGSTQSFGAGSQDMLVAKLYANGSLAWAHTLGGINNDEARALALTATDDIVVAGNSFAGNVNVLVTKLYANGSLAWARTLRRSGNDYGFAIAMTATGDIVVAGKSFVGVADDVLAAKLYANGSLAWARTLGGSNYDQAYALALTATGDIVVAGYTYSFGAGNEDALVAKLYANGSLAWARTLGGSGTEYAQALALTATGDIVVTGYTASFGAGNLDVLVAKLTANGNLAWARVLGGSSSDRGLALTLIPTGDIVVAGYTTSFGAGSDDVLIAKLDANGTISGCNATRSIQPMVLNWASISNVIAPTFMSLNTTGIILQDRSTISTQFITPQELVICFAERNGSMSTQSSAATSTPVASSSSTSNNPPGTSQAATSLPPSTFSSASSAPIPNASTSLSSANPSSLISPSASEMLSSIQTSFPVSGTPSVSATALLISTPSSSLGSGASSPSQTSQTFQTTMSSASTSSPASTATSTNSMPSTSTAPSSSSSASNTNTDVSSASRLNSWVLTTALLLSTAGIGFLAKRREVEQPKEVPGQAVEDTMRLSH